MRTLRSDVKRCPWCQHMIPRKVEASHRCPAKPQTYYPEDARGLLWASQHRGRRYRPS